MTEKGYPNAANTVGLHLPGGEVAVHKVWPLLLIHHVCAHTPKRPTQLALSVRCEQKLSCKSNKKMVGGRPLGFEFFFNNTRQTSKPTHLRVMPNSATNRVKGLFNQRRFLRNGWEILIWQNFEIESYA